MALESKSSAAVALNAIVLGPYDVNLSTAYGLSGNQLTLQVDNVGGGLVTETSNDGVTWYLLRTLSAGLTTVNVGARFVRVRATGAGTPVIAGRLANSVVPNSATDGASAVMVADGADAATGSRSDAVATDNGSWSVISLLKSAASSLRNAMVVVGNVLGGTADSGAPVKIGALYTLATPTFADGQRTDLRTGTRGSLRVEQMVPNGSLTAAYGNDSLVSSNATGSVDKQIVIARGTVGSGTAWFPQAGNADGAFGVSAASADALVAIVPAVTTAAAGSLIAKASAGNVYSIGCTTGATAGYLMLFDSATVPADGTVQPKKTIAVAANTSIKQDFPVPARMGSGITLVFSSTGPFTKTLSATAFLEVMAK
jgi:hypothetical protein